MANLINDLIEVYGVADMFPDCSRAFKQFQVQEILCIPYQKPDVEQILSVHAKVEITRTLIIETSSGISYEGQVLTGKKLIVEGNINQKIQYIADNPVQSVHNAHFSIPFSSYIILGEHMNCKSEYKVDGYIEDVFIKQIGSRKIFKNVMILLNAVKLT